MDINKIALDLVYDKKGLNMFSNLVAKYMVAHLIKTNSEVMERTVIASQSGYHLSVWIRATMHKKNQKTERRGTRGHKQDSLRPFTP